MAGHAGALAAAVHRQLAGPALAALTPGYRRLVEAVVFGGRTVDQYASQTGQPLKAARTNLGTAVGKLALAGHVPVGAAVRIGIDVRPYVERADGRLKAAKATARWELVAEAVALGWTAKRIAAELGEPEGTISKDMKRARDADQPRAEAAAAG